jgi:hypothetical protein
VRYKTFFFGTFLAVKSFSRSQFSIYPLLLSVFIFSVLHTGFPRLKVYADKIFNTDAIVTAAYSLRHGPVAGWMHAVNAVMSPIRVAVEWAIGRISYLFKFTGYRQKLQESQVIQAYVVSAFLTNCRTALYGAQECLYFDIEPPTIEDYLAQ